MTPYYKPAYSFGGPARSTAALCEALVRQGGSVSVYTTDASGYKHLKGSRLNVPLSTPVNIAGVEVTYFPLGTPAINFCSPGLAAALTRTVHAYDFVVSDLLWELLIFPLKQACSKAKIPYFVFPRGQLAPWALHSGMLKKSVYLALLGRAYLQNASGLVCTSNEESQELVDLHLHPPVHIVPNGINLRDFTTLPEGGSWREQLAIPADEAVLLFSGRLTQIKRPDLAIEVCAWLRSQFNLPTHLILAGPDESGLSDRLIRQAQADGVGPYVHIVGMLDENELLRAFVDADMLLMPSEVQENFGLAALEALAAGVPVLTSTGVPVGRYAERAGIGRVALCTSEALSQAAAELLLEPEKLSEMHGRARALVFKDFDIDNIARQFLTVLGSPLEARSLAFV